jgi:hypothetical protein
MPYATTSTRSALAKVKAIQKKKCGNRQYMYRWQYT